VSVAGVALGVTLIMLFTGLARGMSEDLRRRSSNVKAEIIFMRPGGVQLISTTLSLDVAYADRLKQIQGVQDAIPVARYIFQGSKGFGFEQIEGVDWAAYSRMNGTSLVSGHAPSNDEVLVDETKARNNNLHVGSILKPFGNKEYRVAGIYTPESGARVKMTLAELQDAMQAHNKCSHILVKLVDPSQEQEVARRIDAELPHNKIQFTREWFTSIEQGIPYLSIFLRALVGLAAFVSAVVVMLAMYTTITERTREIGILKAMGASRGYIIGIIEKEAVVISLMGLLAGFALSIVVGYFIHRAYGLLFEYSWRWALTSAVIGLGGGALGALYPAMRASNLDPVQALSYE
jgi:putative ABC transport system permease protein